MSEAAGNGLSWLGVGAPSPAGGGGEATLDCAHTVALPMPKPISAAATVARVAARPNRGDAAFVCALKRSPQGVKVSRHVAGLLFIEPEHRHRRARLDGGRIADPADQVRGSIGQLAGDESAPREPEERRADHAACAGDPRNEMAGAAVVMLDDLRAALRAATGDDLLARRITPSPAARGEERESEDASEPGHEVSTPFHRIISHLGNTNTATTCQRIARRKTALTS